jgi:stage V sporulation protein G
LDENKQVPVYRDIDDVGELQSLSAQDEKVAKFHENNAANHAVVDWIAANRQRYFPDSNHFNFDRMMGDMAEQFGLERALHVLLHNVSEHDGRYGDEVKHRSRTESYIMKPPQGFNAREGNSRNADSAEFDFCHTDMHPVYLDSLIKSGMELEKALIRENLPKFELGSTFTDENGYELKIIGKKTGEPAKVGWYDSDLLSSRLGEKPDITLVVGMEDGMAYGGTWIFSMKPDLELNPDNTVTIGDYSREIVMDYAFDAANEDYIKDWAFSAKDFEIGFTYLNHNGSPYTVLDKGQTYFDEPYIKVQSVTDKPEHAWTAWCVNPEICADGTLEWAYSKERDLTVPRENVKEENIMEEKVKLTARMTSLMNGTEKDPDFRGFASVTINDSYAIGSIAVRENTNPAYPNAFYAEMPSVKVGENYVPVVYASPEAREELNAAISDAVKAAIREGRGERGYPDVSAEIAPMKNAKPLSVSVKGNTYENGNVKAYAKVSIAGHFDVNRVKICSGKNGNFISIPSKKDRSDEYRDIVKPITAAAREALIDAVMDKYAEHQRVIGNMEYGKIADKRYASISPANAADIIPQLYEHNIGFSSLPHDKFITLTYSKADEDKVSAILAPFVDKSQAPEIIGNVNYSDISDKSYRYVSAEFAADTAEFLNSKNVPFSAKLSGEKCTFTVNRIDAWKLNAAVDVAKIGGMTRLPDKADVRDFQDQAGRQMDAQIKAKTDKQADRTAI